MILKRENEIPSLDKLCAQREIYTTAKKYFYLQIFVAVISLFMLSLAQLIFSSLNFTLAIATYSIMAVIADNLLERHISKLKERASKVQELFDTYVLDIRWNYILCSSKPEYHEICEYNKKHLSKNDYSKLVNWYEVEIDNVDGLTGKIICQKTNCNYDSIIRKKYSNVVLIIGITTIVSIILFTIFTDISFAKIILTVVFPAVPIIQWTQKNIITNNDSIKNLEQLNSLLNSTWNNIKGGIVIDELVIRQIQDGIYLNRKGSPLIPDFIYEKLRPKLEEQTYYTVSQLVREING